MIDRYIEIAEGNRYLHVQRGFLCIEDKAEGLDARIPLDDINTLIISARWCSLSNHVYSALAERGAPIVFCDKNYNPSSISWPIEGNYRQAAVMDAQCGASVPVHKQLWKAIVRNKIEHQAAVLELCHLNNNPLLKMCKRVKSGDTENHEAQAAAYYFGKLFGPEFKRNRDDAGINAALNYGYMVLRGTVARAVCGAGLHPTLGIHHKSALNPMRLVDDLMEPFRPLIDLVVRYTPDAELPELLPSVKGNLIAMLHARLDSEDGTSSVIRHIRLLAQSLASFYLGESKRLHLPQPILPIQLEAGLGLIPFA